VNLKIGYRTVALLALREVGVDRLDDVTDLAASLSDLTSSSA